MENTTSENKETDDMSSHSMPVLPLVANGYAGDCNRGLEGKDAVLIHANQTSLNSHLLNESVSRNSKSDVIETLNAKFETERGFRDLESRLSQSIRDEAERTRQELFRQEVRVMDRERTDGKFLALEKLIAALGDSA